MKKMLLLVGSFVAISLTGCVMTSGGVSGSLYTNTSAAVSATSANSYARKGSACTSGVLGFAWGDGTIEAAKRQGRINKVTSVNVDNFNILGIYASSCTVVIGE